MKHLVNGTFGKWHTFHILREFFLHSSKIHIRLKGTFGNGEFGKWHISHFIPRRQNFSHFPKRHIFPKDTVF